MASADNAKTVPAQAGKKKKDAIKPVYKPYDPGKLFCEGIVRRVFKVMGTFAAFVFVSLVFGTAVGEGSLFLRLLINGMLLLALWYLSYAEGSSDGETDVALGETTHSRREQGNAVPARDADKGYVPVRGFVVGLLGMLPFLIVTVIYAFTAVRQVYALQTLPSWVSGLSGIEGIGPALAYYDREVALGFVDIVRVISRLLSIPYVNIVGTSDAGRLLLLDRLIPLTLLLPALFYGIGYLTGPRRRAFIHGSIASNKRRRIRREKAERRRRAAGPKELV